MIHLLTIQFDVNAMLNVVLALIMFGLGLGLKKSDFQQLFEQPKSLAVGLFSQMILLPLFALLLLELSPNGTSDVASAHSNGWNIWRSLSPEYRVGVLILSVCPGGITSNLVSYFVKGNVALAVSLTVSNALLSLLSIPLLVNLFLWLEMPHVFGGSADVALPFWGTLFDIFIITIIPAILGMALRFKIGSNIYGLTRIVNFVLPVLLLIVFVAKFLGAGSGGEAMNIQDIFILAPYVIALNIGSMLLGFLAGFIFRLSVPNRITIAIEVGLHNTALALLIAGDKLKNAMMEKPALVYAMFSFVITFGIAFLLVKIYHRWMKEAQ